LTFDERTGVTYREMSGYPEVQQVKVGLSKRPVTMAVAFSIILAGALLFLWNTGGLAYVSSIFYSDALLQGSSTSHPIQNDKKAATSNTVAIGTSNIDGLTLTTVHIPPKVIAGKQVNFKLELGDTSLSTNTIVVTITDNGGQHVLFFPRSHVHKLVDDVQFQYTFPLPGKYNVDITFGGPAAANFNVFVAKSESAI
jgi:hypothetical protein